MMLAWLLYLCLLLLVDVTGAQFLDFSTSNRVPLQDCIGDIVSINERVLVRMVGKPQLLDALEIVYFERQFRETYNMLAIPSCSGGSFITINSVDVQEDFLGGMHLGGGLPANTTEFTLRLRIRGICKGCQKDTLFTLFTPGVLDRKLKEGDLWTGNSDLSHARRDTQEEAEEEGDEGRDGGKGKGSTDEPSMAPTPIPFCPDCLPPRQSDFALSLNAGLQLLTMTDLLDNIDSVSQVTEFDQIFCEDEIVEFSTDVFIDFMGDPGSVTDSQLRSLEQAFQETYNELNLLSEEICDVLFHQIVDVKANLDVDLNRRRLQGSRGFSIQFQILGTSRGGDPNSSIFSVSSPRFLDGKFRDGGNNFRALQGVRDDLCFCPREAQFRSTSRIEFQKGLTDALDSDRFDGSISFIDTVGRVLEVDAVECPDNVEIFEAAVTTEFNGDVDNLSQQDLAQLELLFVRSYNQVQERFCDPLFRTLVNATIIRQLDTSRRQLQFDSPNFTTFNFFTFLIQVTGECRFCSENSSLLFNDAVRRSRELVFLDDTGTLASKSYGHRLQEDDGTCFCDVNFLDEGSLSEVDFQFVYDRNVQEGGVRNVGNVTAVNTFITSSPSISPTSLPSVSPSETPSTSPSVSPSSSPSSSPSTSPSTSPSSSPSSQPSDSPSDSPSDLPSFVPSHIPSQVPSVLPSLGGKGSIPRTPAPTPRPTPFIKRPTLQRRLTEKGAASKGTNPATVQRRGAIRRQM